MYQGKATPMPAYGNPRMIGNNRQSNVTKPIKLVWIRTPTSEAPSPHDQI